MIFMEITGNLAGVCTLYEGFGRSGRRAVVPTYHASMELDRVPEQRVWFHVTRDASDVVFGHTSERFEPGGECPPSRSCAPYRAVIHRSSRIPFALRFYDANCEHGYRLRGTEELERKSILLHHGPARSEGCFLIAGGNSAFIKWQLQYLYLRQQDTDQETLVWVEPRPEQHHNLHLTR